MLKSKFTEKRTIYLSKVGAEMLNFIWEYEGCKLSVSIEKMIKNRFDYVIEISRKYAKKKDELDELINHLKKIRDLIEDAERE